MTVIPRPEAIDSRNVAIVEDIEQLMSFDAETTPFGTTFDYEMLADPGLIETEEGKTYLHQLFMFGDIDLRRATGRELEIEDTKRRVKNARSDFLKAFGVKEPDSEVLRSKTSTLLRSLRVLHAHSGGRPIVVNSAILRYTPERIIECITTSNERLAKLTKLGFSIDLRVVEDIRIEHMNRGNNAEFVDIDRWSESFIEEEELSSNAGVFLSRFKSINGDQSELFEKLARYGITPVDIYRSTTGTRSPSINHEYLATIDQLLTRYGLDPGLVFQAVPEIVLYTPEVIESKIAVLESANMDVRLLLQRGVRLLRSSSTTLERGLHYTLGYDKISGIDANHIVRLIERDPMLLVMTPKRIRFLARFYSFTGLNKSALNSATRISIPNALAIVVDTVNQKEGHSVDFESVVRTLHSHDFTSGSSRFSADAELLLRSNNSALRKLAKKAILAIPKD